MRSGIDCLAVCLLALAGAAIFADEGADDRRGGRRPDRADLPLRLEVLAPGDSGRRGALQTTRWPLILRIEAASAPALVESPEGDLGRREAIVLRDPDDCIDMRDFPILDPGTPYEPCAGPDELYVEFTSERFDGHDIEDDRTGNFQVRDRLVDDPYQPGALLNTAYLRDAMGRIRPVPRPQTGGDLLDGYGYGPDDDLVGLVLMADVGAARVFDPDFNLVSATIRNMAGLLNGVSVELADRTGKTALIASMHALAGQFEPIAQFDLAVSDPAVDYLRRLESGPVEAFRFDEPPASDEELLALLVASYSPYEIELGAVVVAGVAPAWIHDEDGDGRYTAADLERMGFTPLSNSVTVGIRELADLVYTETLGGQTCPSRSLIFADLDGDGEDGAIDCSGTGGARRIRRIPR